METPKLDDLLAGLEGFDPFAGLAPNAPYSDEVPFENPYLRPRPEPAPIPEGAVYLPRDEAQAAGRLWIAEKAEPLFRAGYDAAAIADRLGRDALVSFGLGILDCRRAVNLAVGLLRRRKLSLDPAPMLAEGEEEEPAFVPASEVLARRPDEGIEWILPGFLPRGYLVVLGGTSKAGKSVFLTALCLAVLRGEPFMGATPEPCPAVLWLAFEESEGERAMTLREFGTPPDGLYLMRRRCAIDRPEGLADIESWVKKTDARLVVVDPLYAAHSQEGLTDGQSARRALQGLKDLTNRTGCTVVVIHHINKNLGIGMTRDRMADSNQILASASMDLLMEARMLGDGSEREIRLHGKGRGSFCNRVWRLLSKGVASFEPMGEDEEEAPPALSRTMRKVLELLEEGGELTAKEIGETLGIAASGCRSVMKAMVERSLISFRKTEGRGTTYRYFLPRTEESSELF